MTVSEAASNQAGEQLRDYELVLIVNPQIDDERFEGTIDSVTRLITGKGGMVSEVERWGRRRLAYPVKHYEEGSYVLARCKLTAAQNRELEANLTISEDILRHLLVKVS